ncbi:MAG: hypothetical protein JJE46_08685 [Acidimicrobiia bacterium]|nr:hypothetical protein [Acidimicrobiia bacterium]
MLHRRRRPPPFVVIAVIAVALGACGSSGPAARPKTPATLQILALEPNAQVGPDVDVRVVLRHAHLVPSMQIGGTVRPREGHLHFSLDGRIVAMTNKLSEPLRNLTPGEHTVGVEFVAADHLPFANHVVAAVSFQVT